LARRGADPVLIDGTWFPETLTIAFDPSDGSGEIALRNGRTIGFGDVTSVYWRTYDGIGAVDLPDPDQRAGRWIRTDSNSPRLSLEATSRWSGSGRSTAPMPS
jgi:hypothetical protein